MLELIIGFTFAIALARFEVRRDAVVNEANAIGTTALRARVLPEPNRIEALKLLRDYMQIRDIAELSVPTERFIQSLTDIIDDPGKRLTAT